MTYKKTVLSVLTILAMTIFPSQANDMKTEAALATEFNQKLFSSDTQLKNFKAMTGDLYYQLVNSSETSIPVLDVPPTTKAYAFNNGIVESFVSVDNQTQQMWAALVKGNKIILLSNTNEQPPTKLLHWANNFPGTTFFNASHLAEQSKNIQPYLDTMSGNWKKINYKEDTPSHVQLLQTGSHPLLYKINPDSLRKEGPLTSIWLMTQSTDYKTETFYHLSWQDKTKVSTNVMIQVDQEKNQQFFLHPETPTTITPKLIKSIQKELSHLKK